MSSKFTIKQIFQDHWSDFLKENHNIRSVVMTEVSKMMECGDPSKGHALYYCEHCNKFKYVYFRCHSRFCNTCGTAYQMDRSDSIASKLINCKHRHIVFTIPDELRLFFRKDRSLLDVLFKASSKTILDWFFSQSKSQHFIPGIINSLHTFGRDLKWNPHIHMLLSEGAAGNTNPWKNFHFFPFNMLRKKWQATLLHLIQHSLDFTVFNKSEFFKLKKYLFSSYPDGFYVYAPDSEFNSPHAVSNYITRYIGRPAMAQSRIINYDGTSVTFWYQRHEDNEKIIETLPAHEFIKRLIVHIPDKHFNMLRYYGLYAMKHIHSQKFVYLLSREFVKTKRLFTNWASRIELSFGFDPTKCSCGRYMYFVALFVPNSVPKAPT